MTGRRPASAPARLRGRLRATLRHPGLVVGLALVAVIVAAALVGSVWTPYPPKQPDFSVQLQGPSPSHPFGTDEFGRDLLSRILVGAGLSLRVGVGAVAIGLVAGASIGLIAGWRRGWVDDVVMRLVDVLYAFPAILMALLLSATFRPGTLTATVAIGLAFVPQFARIARASALTSRTSAHVEASRALGSSPWRTFWTCLVPDAASPLIVQASLSLSLAVLAEAALSFLGLGSAPDAASWGVMLRDAQGFLGLSPWPALVPGAAIFSTVLGWSLLGDGLRDVLDPRTR